MAKGASGLSDFLKISLAKAWFQENCEKIRDLICTNENLSELREREESVGEITIMAAIADIAVQYFSFPAIASLGVLIFRYGLNKLCGCDK
jgi:hypothetical protein